ncbi:MAG: carboxypeptidase-like regulatory domain-containing protein, partial [Gammaproteobacteria bacterium]
MRTFILALFAGCLTITNVWAEHEVDHRYNIRGYVLDGSQQGISDQDVRVFDGSSLLKETRTDSSGYYSLHLHLHNADNRKILKLRAGANEAKLRVTFDPEDLKT